MKTQKPNHLVSIPVVVLFSLLLIFAVPSSAQKNENQKGASPYFLVITHKTEVDQLPLRSTKASVRISGVIASVTNRQ
jgi:hypothetical protein